MNIPMVVITSVIWLFLVCVVPMLAEMSVFFGSLIFILGLVGNSPAHSFAIWVGLISSLCSLGVIWAKKNNAKRN